MTDRPAARMCIFLQRGAAEAARFYAETLPDTQVDLVQAIGPEMDFVLFRVMGTPFMAMDGNESFEPRHDHSISIATLDQAETDRLWAALREGGEEGRCGWLRDRFGVHWQLIPTEATHMLSDPDRAAAARAQQAMMGMTKLDIAAMRAAHRDDGSS